MSNVSEPDLDLDPHGSLTVLALLGANLDPSSSNEIDNKCDMEAFSRIRNSNKMKAGSGSSDPLHRLYSSLLPPAPILLDGRVPWPPFVSYNFNA